MYDFTLITYQELIDLDPDDDLLRQELVSRGKRVQVAVWNDSGIDWSKSGVCVVRSTWDYHQSLDQFLAWMEKVDKTTSLVNPLSIMKWNCRKTYLRDLSDRGIPIAPTIFVEPEAHAKSGDRLIGILEEQGWKDAVVKPSIGLATSGVRRVSLASRTAAEDESHFRKLLCKGTVLVQEFMPTVYSIGERNLIFLGGTFSHAIRKSPFQKLAIARHAGEEPAVATEKDLTVADQILRALPIVPSYARIDLLEDDHGTVRLMELELIEPSLFLSMHAPAARRFADILCGIQSKPSPPTPAVVVSVP